jgi:hypothetical protein
MQKLADRYLRRQWNERETLKNALTGASCARADRRPHAAARRAHPAHALREDHLVGRSAEAASGTRDAPTLATLSTGEGAEMTGRDPDTIAIPGPTKGMVLDMPLVSDATIQVAPAALLRRGQISPVGFWPGATLYKGRRRRTPASRRGTTSIPRRR